MKSIGSLCLQLLLITSCYAQENIYAASQVMLLNEQLLFYQKIQVKDWTYFPCDQYLDEGDRSMLVPLLRKNLSITGDLESSADHPSDSTLLDTEVAEAVKRFQRRHNLIDDGVFGARTIKAMNVPLSERWKQIQNALLKWQKFSQINEQTYLLVNLPDFTLNIIDSGIPIQRIKAIIGKKTTPTKIFYSELSYLVIHPYWIIPRPIAISEILPSIQSDGNYLSSNKIEVFSYKNGKRIKLLADTVQWYAITKENFHYEFVQTPGPWNALGAIKFMFPNEFNIYIHDTPEKYLFHYNKRMFTHGCIRIEYPEDLAAWLLHKSNDEIDELLADCPDDSFFPLSQTICTYIDHFNVWVDTEGFLQFREDVYPQDRK